MMDGCLERPKTSAQRRKTRVARYWLAPLIRLTTAMTEVTPMTTPISVSTLRNLCAQRLDVAIDTASARCMVEARGIRVASCPTSYYTQRKVAELQWKSELYEGARDAIQIKMAGSNAAPCHFLRRSVEIRTWL